MSSFFWWNELEYCFLLEQQPPITLSCEFQMQTDNFLHYQIMDRAALSVNIKTQEIFIAIYIHTVIFELVLI